MVGSCTAAVVSRTEIRRNADYSQPNCDDCKRCSAWDAAEILFWLRMGALTRLETCQELLRVLWSICWKFPQAIHDELCNRRGNVRRQITYRNGRCAHMGSDELMRRGPIEGRVTREHLICEASERIDVRSVISRGIADGLFRCHVSRSAYASP